VNNSNALTSVEETRSASRTNICLIAALIVAGKSLSVRIRNLSPSGALVDGASLPPAGTAVLLSRSAQQAAGKVVWSDNGRCGIHFTDRLTVPDWLPGASGSQNKSRFDLIVAEIAPGATRAVVHQPQFEKIDAAKLDRRLADEVACAARTLENLRSALAKEPSLVPRHSAELRNLDLVREILGRVATILESDDMAETARNLGMDDRARPHRN